MKTSLGIALATLLCSFACFFSTVLSQSSTAVSTCTESNATSRKEWGSLTTDERKSYISAVKCLQNRPSILDDVPGAKSRYDDFLAIHINQSTSIHISSIFLSWHRNFVWLYENALREECGYKGYQPYWNWALWCTDLAGSPLFDGSETSLSGDGYYNPDQGPYTVVGATLPRGTGGGCIKDGPFANLTANMGPFNASMLLTGLPSNWSDYTPHCLPRDLNNYIATLYGNQTAVDVLMATQNISEFQSTMTGIDINLGVHTGGHYSIGLGLQDQFASPADPAFYLHHAMIDKVWASWQAMDPAERQFALNGTSTVFNAPTTPEVTLQTVQNWGVLGMEKKTGELMSIAAGDFCYKYV